jgi:GntR family transcriptional regulator, galactonate operon transcriptional repressor
MESIDAAGISGRGESLAERAARVIGRAVVCGEHAPGAALPVEADLARAMGVSRNVVREAVKTLAAKGLLRTNRRGGTIVLPVARWNLLDPQVVGWALAAEAHRAIALAELSQLAAMVLPEIAVRAAHHARTTQMLRLAETCEAMAAADDAIAVHAQIAFLAHLFDAARNRIAASLAPAFAALWRAAPSRRNDAAYRAVAEAVQRRDGAAARQAMIELVAAGETGASTPRVRVRAGRQQMPPH